MSRKSNWDVKYMHIYLSDKDAMGAKSNLYFSLEMKLWYQANYVIIFCIDKSINSVVHQQKYIQFKPWSRGRSWKLLKKVRIHLIDLVRNMFLLDIILVIGAKTEDWEDDSYDDAVVGAVVLAVCLEWTPDEEKSVLVLFAFLGEEGKGELGGTEAGCSGFVATPSLSVLPTDSPAPALGPPAAEGFLGILEANIVMRCILCTITIACIRVWK